MEKLEEILFSDRFLKMAELALKEEAADREPDTATMIKLAASLTPILGDISDACMEQSLGYLENIGIKDWALKSNGCILHLQKLRAITVFFQCLIQRGKLQTEFWETSPPSASL